MTTANKNTLLRAAIFAIALFLPMIIAINIDPVWLKFVVFFGLVLSFGIAGNKLYERFKLD